jgi:hypothetical protein
MIVSHSIQPFRRFGVMINESFWIDGEPWFTAKAISEWLGLKVKDDAVQQIVRRNPYILEYSKKITVLDVEGRPFNLKGDTPKKSLENTANKIKRGGHQITTSDQINQEKKPKPREMKITLYNPIALQLIAMESGTPRAQQYKIAAASLVWNLYKARMKKLTEAQIEKEKILLDEISALPGFKLKEIRKYMKKTGCCRATAFNHLKMIKQGESPNDIKRKGPHQNNLISGDYEMQIREIFFKNPNLGYKSIYKRIGKPESPSLSTVKLFVKKLKNEITRG